MKAILAAAAVLSLLVVTGCAAVGSEPCPEGMAPHTELNMYFGLEKGDGSHVSEAEWQTFLDEAITPRFPDGLTVDDASGQWLDTVGGQLYREPTKLLNVLVPSDQSDEAISAIDEIAEAYKERFNQQAVFSAALLACAKLS